MYEGYYDNYEYDNNDYEGEEDEDEEDEDEEDQEDEEVKEIPQEQHKDKSQNMNVMTEMREILAKIDRPGDFATAGSAEALCLPKLHVEGVGIVPLPVVDMVANALKPHLTPFKRREEDTANNATIRHSWQLDPSRFSLESPTWTDNVNEIVSKIGKNLGCEGAVSAHLHKLLLDETGACFKPHLDTEKEPGMFATLMIVLPSIFSGGRLVVRHGEEVKSFDFAEEISNHAHYMAFFCDLEHESEVITSGYRLCVVYNLVVDAKAQKPVPFARAALTLQLWQTLHRWNETALKNEPPHRIIIPLDHKYTEAHLSIAHLKDRDQAIGQMLQRVSEATNTIISFVTLEKETSRIGEQKDTDYFIWSKASSINAKNFPWEIHGAGYRGFGFSVFYDEITNRHAFSLQDFVDSKVEYDEEGTIRKKRYHKTALILLPRVRLLATKLGASREADIPKEIANTLKSFRAMDADERIDNPEFKTFSLSVQVSIATLLSKKDKLVAFIVADMISLGDWTCFLAFFNDPDVLQLSASPVAQVFLAAIAARGWAAVEPSLTVFIRSTNNPLTGLQVLSLMANAHNEAKQLHRDRLKAIVSNLSILDTLKPHSLDLWGRHENNELSTVLQMIVRELAFEEECLGRIFAYLSAKQNCKDFLMLCELIGKENPHVARTSPNCLAAYTTLVDLCVRSAAVGISEHSRRTTAFLLNIDANQALQVLFSRSSIVWQDMSRFVALLKQHYFTDPRVHTLLPTITNLIRTQGGKCEVDLLVFALVSNTTELFDLLLPLMAKLQQWTINVLNDLMKPTGWAFRYLQLVTSSPRFYGILSEACSKALEELKAAAVPPPTTQLKGKRQRDRPVPLPHVDVYLYTMARLGDRTLVTAFYEKLATALIPTDLVRASYNRVTQNPEIVRHAVVINSLMNSYPGSKPTYVLPNHLTPFQVVAAKRAKR